MAETTPQYKNAWDKHKSPARSNQRAIESQSNLTAEYTRGAVKVLARIGGLIRDFWGRARDDEGIRKAALYTHIYSPRAACTILIMNIDIT